MTEKDAIRRWSQTWQQYGPELERIRLREARDEDTFQSLRLLTAAFNHATREHRPDESPGLVEMQRGFAKLREKLQRP